MNNQQTEPRADKPAPLLIVLGTSLIASGACAVVYVVLQIFSVYTDWNQNTFITSISATLKDEVLFKNHNLPFVVADGGALTIAFIIFGILTLIAAHLGMVLVVTGAKMMYPSLEYEISKIKTDIREIRRRVR